MSFRVNLLNEEEQRREGPVSRKFAVLAAAVGGGAVLLVVAGALILRSVSAGQKHREFSKRWEEVEPLHKQLKDVQATVRNRQGLIRELEGWSRSRISAEMLLERLQLLTPETVQLTRLELRATQGVERKPASAKDKAPPKIWREYRGLISGQAFGEKSEDTAVGFVQQITDDAQLSGYFDSVKLQRLQRPALTGRNLPADVNLGHIFSIELASPPRRFE